MFDVLITGGAIVDGTGKPGYPADLGIVGEKINAIGDLSHAQARRYIDATGHVVSPGFIDAHVHSDAVLLTDGQHPQGLRQGITTEILGQDGLSYVPSSPENYRMYNHYLSGILGRAPDDLDMSSVTAFKANYHHKTAINVVTNIAHGALRVEACGMYDVPMVGDRLEHAKRLVWEGMEQGAVGLATGMSYHPQAWSNTQELIELCKIVAEFDGVYTTHLRDVNPDRGFGGGGVPEALEIGRRSGVKVHFSHTRTAVGNAGQTAELMKQFDEAKDEVDLTLELYPYPTGSSFVLSNMPSQAHNGGPAEIIERLQDADERAIIAKHIESSDARVVREFVYSHMPLTPEFEGLTVPTLAERLGKSLGEVTIDLLLEKRSRSRLLGSPARQHNRLATGQPRRRRAALAHRLHGRQRLHPRRRPSAPPRMGHLPPLPRQAAPPVPHHVPRIHGPAHDRQRRPSLRTHRAWPPGGRLFRRRRRLRPRPHHRHRHLRRPPAVPRRHPVRHRQRPGRRRPRTLHRHHGRPGHPMNIPLSRSPANSPLSRSRETSVYPLSRSRERAGVRATPPTP